MKVTFEYTSGFAVPLYSWTAYVPSKGRGKLEVRYNGKHYENTRWSHSFSVPEISDYYDMLSELPESVGAQAIDDAPQRSITLESDDDMIERTQTVWVNNRSKYDKQFEEVWYKAFASIKTSLSEFGIPSDVLGNS